MSRLLFFLFLVCFIISGFENGLAQNRKYYDNLKKSKKNTIIYSKQMLGSLETNSKNQLDRLLILKEQIRKQKEILHIVNKEILLINEEIQLDENRLNQLNNNLDELKKEYAQLIYFASLNMNVQRRMIYILSAQSFNMAYKRMIYLKQLSDYRKNKSIQINESIRNIDSSLANLKNLKLEKEALNIEKTAGLDSLNKRRKELDRLIGSTNNRIVELNSQISQEVKKTNEIKTAVKKEINVVEENKEIPESKKSHKLDGDISKKFREYKHKHIWPLDKCVVLQHYGDYYHPKYENIIIKNDGIELGAGGGKNVHAIFEGKVVSTLPIPGEGYSIIIQHGDFYSVYSKVENVIVKQGDVVDRAQIIAKLPRGGDVRKLIFQLWYGKEKLNPEIWLKKR